MWAEGARLRESMFDSKACPDRAADEWTFFLFFRVFFCLGVEGVLRVEGVLLRRREGLLTAA